MKISQAVVILFASTNSSHIKILASSANGSKEARELVNTQKGKAGGKKKNNKKYTTKAKVNHNGSLIPTSVPSIYPSALPSLLSLTMPSEDTTDSQPQMPNDKATVLVKKQAKAGKNMNKNNKANKSSGIKSASLTLPSSLPSLFPSLQPSLWPSLMPSSSIGGSSIRSNIDADLEMTANKDNVSLLPLKNDKSKAGKNKINKTKYSKGTKGSAKHTTPAPSLFPSVFPSTFPSTLPSVLPSLSPSKSFMPSSSFVPSTGDTNNSIGGSSIQNDVDLVSGMTDKKATEALFVSKKSKDSKNKRNEKNTNVTEESNDVNYDKTMTNEGSHEVVSVPKQIKSGKQANTKTGKKNKASKVGKKSTKWSSGHTTTLPSLFPSDFPSVFPSALPSPLPSSSPSESFAPSVSLVPSMSFSPTIDIGRVGENEAFDDQQDKIMKPKHRS